MPVVVLTCAALALPVSNLELAEQIVSEACVSISDSLVDSGVGTVMLEIAGDHPGNWLVEQCVKTELGARGLTVLTRETRPAPDSSRDHAMLFDLVVRPMELSIVFGGTSRSWLIGPKSVERMAVCELYSELRDTGGTICTTVRSSSSRSDRVPVDDLQSLRGSSDQVWLRGGELQASSGGILEPLVVTGVVASLIYLFYSSRAE
ncbi:MAG: hypothetical protein IT351_02170 [Candidatus Fermentibacter sp.]|nr:hypothetical protein [Candidatus Fermentibacter sp.]